MNDLQAQAEIFVRRALASFGQIEPESVIAATARKVVAALPPSSRGESVDQAVDERAERRKRGDYV